MTGLADDIVDVLSPVIGKGLATSAVNMQCKKLGILPGDLSEQNIEEFSRHFERMMQIFAGDLVAHDIVMKMKSMTKKNVQNH